MDNDNYCQDKVKLKTYLCRYRMALMQMTEIERRLTEIQTEAQNPLASPKLSGMPHSGSVSSTVENLALRKAEIEEKLKAQSLQVKEYLLSVMEITELLPTASYERFVLEKRYIDGEDWYNISTQLGLARSTCHRYLDDGINKLLQLEFVKATIG